jgi:hypothetical protein
MSHNDTVAGNSKLGLCKTRVPANIKVIIFARAYRPLKKNAKWVVSLLGGSKKMCFTLSTVYISNSRLTCKVVRCAQVTRSSTHQNQI